MVFYIQEQQLIVALFKLLLSDPRHSSQRNILLGGGNSYLSGEVDCTGLAFGTDALRPGRVVTATSLHLAVQVFQISELTPVRKEILETIV